MGHTTMQTVGNGDNEITFIGNLGHDIDSFNTTRTGTPVANFRIASTRQLPAKDGRPGKEITTWMTVQVFGAMAANLAASGVAVKGARVMVVGELVPDSYRASDGTDIDTVAIRARDVGFSTRTDGIDGDLVEVDADTGLIVPGTARG